MSELMSRPYVEDDAAAVADLMNTIEAVDGADPFFSEPDVRSHMASWLKDPDRDSRLEWAPDGSLVACAMVAAPPAGGELVDTFGGVHPDWRRRGIGGELMTWELARAVEMHAERSPGIEWQVDTGTNVKDASGIALYERFGMKPVRYFFEMYGDTAGVPVVAVPEGLRLVPYSPELRLPTYEAHHQAFSDHWGYERTDEAEWTKGTVASETFRADLSRVALDGDAIAGYLLAYDNVDNRLYIGQVGTMRAWRKRGVASALLAASLAAGAADGKALALLGVDADSPTGAVGVYERLGFRMKTQFVVYRRPLAG